MLSATASAARAALSFARFDRRSSGRLELEQTGFLKHPLLPTAIVAGIAIVYFCLYLNDDGKPKDHPSGYTKYSPPDSPREDDLGKIKRIENRSESPSTPDDALAAAACVGRAKLQQPPADWRFSDKIPK